MSIIWVGLGGCIGSILRYLVNIGIARLLPQMVFPWATFIVNMLGCFLIGFLAGYGANRQLLAPAKLFMITGILGGFTTFSAFGLESFLLLKSEQWLIALANIVIQVILGVLLVYVGNKVAMQL